MNFICAEVEMNKLSLLRPTLLLRYDYMVIDKRDYEEILYSKENGWHRILRNNLKFLYDIGAIRIIDFQNNLTFIERKSIRERGHEIVQNLTRKEKKRLLLKTWKDYINYIEIKTFHLQGNEKDYRTQKAFLYKLNKHYDSIKNNNWDTETQDYILESCFWKTIASSIISKKTQNATLHLAEEYSPFVDYIKPIHGDERILKIDALVKHIYSLTLPSVRINNFNEQKAFIELRKNKLKEYLNLCEYLNELLISFENDGLSIEETKKYISDRWNYGYQTVDNFFLKMKNLSLLPEYLVQVIFKTFKYFFPIPDIALPNGYIKEFSKKINPKPLNALKHSKEEWQVAFCTVFNEKEIKHIKKVIQKEYPVTYDKNRLQNWIENIGYLPWYVK